MRNFLAADPRILTKELVTLLSQETQYPSKFLAREVRRIRKAVRYDKQTKESTLQYDKYTEQSTHQYDRYTEQTTV